VRHGYCVSLRLPRAGLGARLQVGGDVGLRGSVLEWCRLEVVCLFPSIGGLQRQIIARIFVTNLFIVENVLYIHRLDVDRASFLIVVVPLLDLQGRRLRDYFDLVSGVQRSRG
jgi:hypothetical protein